MLLSAKNSLSLLRFIYGANRQDKGQLGFCLMLDPSGIEHDGIGLDRADLVAGMVFSVDKFAF